MSSSRRTNILLAAGLLAGAALAALGILREGRPASPSVASEEYIAVVNGKGIPRARYEQAIALLERDRGRPATTQERQRSLDRIIDEELLVQKANELGIPQSDRKLRADSVAAVLETVMRQTDVPEPSDRELRRFFEDNKVVLSGPGQVRIAVVFVAAERADGRERAAEAARRLRAGEDVAAVRSELGDASAVSVPDALVPAGRVSEYVGPTAAARLQQMKPGEVSDPIGATDGFRVVVLLERADAEATFESLRSQTLAEYRRQSAEAQVTRYLDELRHRASVKVTPDAGGAATVGLVAPQ